MKRALQLGLTSRMLLLANGVLALMILLQLAYPARIGGSGVEAQADPSELLPDFGDTAISAPGMAELPDILERPVFFVSRRMPEPEAEAPPTSEAQPTIKQLTDRRLELEKQCDPPAGFFGLLQPVSGPIPLSSGGDPSDIVAGEEAAVPKKIFIGYRRGDTFGTAKLIYERLAAYYGPKRVFFDTSGIEPGDDFVALIWQEIAEESWPRKPATTKCSAWNGQLRKQKSTALTESLPSSTIPTVIVMTRPLSRNSKRQLKRTKF